MTDSTAVLEIRDPADGSLVGTLPVAGPHEVADAVARARDAAPAWAALPAGDRGGLLREAAARVEAAADELALLTTREMGKPLADARGGVDAGVGTLRQYAELGPVHGSRSLQGTAPALDLMVREPRGVVAAITPWNDPVAVACGLLGAALVTGNAVVAKPSERTPHTGRRLVELMAQVLPSDVLQVLDGDATTGAALAAHLEVDVVAHVGSTRAGQAIARSAAGKVVRENGGKDALLVDADVDPVWAARQAALGAFANAGQICVAVERIYVQRSVAVEFLDALVAEARNLRMGPGTDPSTTLGPLVDDRARATVHGHVADAVKGGARALTGGAVPDGPGAFYPATVLVDVPDDAVVVTEETFGPVAPVRVVDSFDEALSLAAASRYGLAATVLTADMEHAARAVRALPVGTVKVNAVFGGAPGGAAHPNRDSGEGFGYGPELLDEFTRVKVVHWGMPVRRVARYS